MIKLSTYERAMGDTFNRLSPAVRRFHRLAGLHRLHGWAATDAPSGLCARLLSMCLGTPLQSKSGAIQFELHAGPTSETWTRHFPDRTMRSELRLTAPQVVEQLGFCRLTFELGEQEGRLEMQLVKLHFLGAPCPRWLLPTIVAQESGEGDRLLFRARASLPAVGTVASYTGYLVISGEESP